MSMITLISELKQDEGLRLQAYQDHKNVWTIGYGTNLQTLEITESLAERFLRERVDELIKYAERLPVYMTLSQCRKDVILSMMYQMGVRGTMNFARMWAALAGQNFATAALEMKDSKWWHDPLTRARANRMSVRMSTNMWDI